MFFLKQETYSRISFALISNFASLQPRPCRGQGLEATLVRAPRTHRTSFLVVQGTLKLLTKPAERIVASRGPFLK